MGKGKQLRVLVFENGSSVTGFRIKVYFRFRIEGSGALKKKFDDNFLGAEERESVQNERGCRVGRRGGERKR